MGNFSCNSVDLDETRNKVFYERKHNTTDIQLILGDILQEEGDYYAFYNVDTAQEEDIVFNRHHSLCKMNCKVPYFIDLYHLKNYYQIHCKMLREQKSKILVIQDPCCFKNPIPKLYNAEVLIAAILLCDSLPPKIKIISPTLENLKFMRYELDKMLSNSSLLQNIMEFIDPPQKAILEREREEDVLRQQANFSLSQIQFLNDI